jgi:hypothetical protein
MDEDPDVRKAAEARFLTRFLGRALCSSLLRATRGFVKELEKAFSAKYKVSSEKSDELRNAVMLYRAAYSSPLTKKYRLSA